MQLTVTTKGGIFGGRPPGAPSGRTGRRVPRPPGLLTPIESGFEALAIDFGRFVREQDRLAPRRSAPSKPRTPPKRPAAASASRPVLHGACAMLGFASAGPDPTAPMRLGKFTPRLMFARGAFGDAPGVGKMATAWLATARGWESVGVPRFRADGSFLRFELACVTPKAKALAAHVRSGGFLSAEVDFAPVAEHTDRLTRTVTRAEVRGVVLRVGAGVKTTFPLCHVGVR